MPELKEVAPDAVDPRIARHLEEDERVLWQGKPRPGTFFSPLGIMLCLFLIGFGAAQALGLLAPYMGSGEGGLVHVALGMFLIAVAGAVLVSLWRRRGVNWAYAITDRRLMSARGARLHRSVKPEEIREVKQRGDIAHWRLRNPPIRANRDKRDMESRFPGFHGQQDAAATVALLNDWREQFTTRAGEEAARFVKHVGAEHPPDDVPDGVRRLHHPATGLTIDVPPAWAAKVSQDWIGPVRVLGFTLLKRFIRPGEERDYGDGADWNTLTLRGAPDAGLNLTVLDMPLTQTLDAVLNDPWAKRFKLEVLQTTPDLEVGGLSGFSLVRQMQEGANLASLGPVAAPVATRHAWLGRGGMHLEIVGMARLDQPDLQRAVDAMLASIRMPNGGGRAKNDA